MPLEPQRSQYRQLADLLRDAITGGDFPPGSLLPSEPVLAERYGLSINDAMIAASVLDADCDTLWSEDMQDGFVWSGVTIVNPFAKSRHPLLETLLNQ